MKYFTVELVIKDYEIIDFKDKEQNTEDNKMEDAPFRQNKSTYKNIEKEER